ncbi:MAG TPA: type I-C CRISPR-associated protein Cas7/Csd2 [Candidatus Dormibacteraeota bacterium]|nr:type I-C CRISPR-associated protein Cas7/Csd2 [Candidatus Dormibacteraeota bacterium]
MGEVWTDSERRHDFKLLFDVTDGNPNGDPDAGNLPRVDPETMQGLVTDVAIKRKVRNWVTATRKDEAPWRIYVQNRGIALNTLHQEAYTATGLKSTGSRQSRKDVEQARRWMCEQFFDVRTFGAVMSTGVNCGQVRGPVQIGFARSVDPITPLDLSITRVAVTEQAQAEVVVNEQGEGAGGKQTEMGRKALVPYGLYVAVGQVSPLFARDTGFGDEDLALFWEALIRCWDMDRSAARGVMCCRGLHVFTHTSPYGDAPAHELLDRVRVSRREGVEAPRRFADYRVEIDRVGLPEGVTLTSLVG